MILDSLKFDKNWNKLVAEEDWVGMEQYTNWLIINKGPEDSEVMRLCKKLVYRYEEFDPENINNICEQFCIRYLGVLATIALRANAEGKEKMPKDDDFMLMAETIYYGILYGLCSKPDAQKLAEMREHMEFVIRTMGNCYFLMDDYAHSLVFARVKTYPMTKDRMLLDGLASFYINPEDFVFKYGPEVKKNIISKIAIIDKMPKQEGTLEPVRDIWGSVAYSVLSKFYDLGMGLEGSEKRDAYFERRYKELYEINTSAAKEPNVKEVPKAKVSTRTPASNGLKNPNSINKKEGTASEKTNSGNMVTTKSQSSASAPTTDELRKLLRGEFDKATRITSEPNKVNSQTTVVPRSAVSNQTTTVPRSTVSNQTTTVPRNTVNNQPQNVPRTVANTNAVPEDIKIVNYYWQTRNYQQMYAWSRHMVDLKIKEAYYYLAYIYEKGLFVNANKVMAVEMYRQASTFGNANAKAKMAALRNTLTNIDMGKKIEKPNVQREMPPSNWKSDFVYKELN